MKYRNTFLLVTLFAITFVVQSAPEVKLEQGIVSGIVSTDGTRLEYIGIPYATANSSNRFQAPLPAPKWEGVYKATDQYSCSQYSYMGTKLEATGTEDCLKVNVYVPTLEKQPLPVMVYIHGGAFAHGSGGKLIYGPDFIVKQDVILVTFNYRLGVLGFLCLGIKEAPGNAGLKDQIAALRWIKKNIAAFGGDPDNITLFGESAGGTSASLMLASEATHGLFDRVIIQSGSAVTHWAINRKPVLFASLLAKNLGHDTEDPHEIYKILSKIPYKDLVALQPEEPNELFFGLKLLHLPCVEKPIPGEEAAINDLPYNLLRKKPKNIPVIHGSTSKEGFLSIVKETEESLEKRNSQYLFASDLEFPSNEEAASVNKRLKEFYFGKDRISMAKKANVVDLYTHLDFEMPSIIETEILLSSRNAPVYSYYFNYSGGRNFMKSKFGVNNEYGACHADELLYLFSGLINTHPVKKNDQKVIDWMTKMWTNFAKFGDPTPSFATDLPVKWIPNTKDKLNFLYIDDTLKIGPLPNKEAYHLWKDVYNKYRIKDSKHFS